MKIGKIISLVLAILFFSGGFVQGKEWLAGPALIAGEKSKVYRTVERRMDTSVTRVPGYDGDNLSFKKRFNERMEKEADYFLTSLNGNQKKRRKIKWKVSGWLQWQEGKKGDFNSIVLVESVMYEKAAHPINYVKGITLDRDGKRLTFSGLKSMMPELTLEKLKKETAKQARKRNLPLFPNYTITEFPKEFYIGTNNHVYFIFQQYDIAPYSTGWIMIDMGSLS